MPLPSVRTFLDSIVDYAGLFPPAQLGMSAAVARFARYHAGPDCWLLGRFVVPVARLEEFEDIAAPHLAAAAEEGEKERGRGRGVAAHLRPWRVSALGGAAHEEDAECILRFNSRHATGQRVDVVVDAVETKAASPEEIVRAATAYRDLGAHVFVELPVAGGDPRPLIDAACANGVRAKVRLGGVTPEAFPATADVARFIVACADAKLPFKATAGLHHLVRGEYPVTYAPDAPLGTMFGFLNVFLAAAFAHGGLPIGEVEQLLEERDPAALSFDADGAAWRAHRLTPLALARARREGATSFGSCSFEEPVEELRSLGLL